LEEERGIAVLSLEVRSSGLDDVRQVTELSLGAFFLQSVGMARCARPA
jgi:hypothetical protein